LRDHLGAEQNVDLALAHALQDPMVRPLGGCGIEVHPGDSRLRKTLGHQTLELLGSRPPIAHGRTGADRTRKWNRCLIITVVTAEQVWVAVYGESNTAIGTLDRLT